MAKGKQKLVVTLDDLLGSGLKVKQVTIASRPDQIIFIRELGGADRQEIMSLIIDKDNDHPCLDALITSKALCDENGNLLAGNDKGAKRLAEEMRGDELADIADEICYHNGFKEKAIDDAEKSSEANQND